MLYKITIFMVLVCVLYNLVSLFKRMGNYLIPSITHSTSKTENVGNAFLCWFIILKDAVMT